MERGTLEVFEKESPGDDASRPLSMKMKGGKMGSFPILLWLFPKRGLSR